MKHCKFSPSSAARWLECPGSLTLPARPPAPESEWAAEGRAAHALAERCLLIGADPLEASGEWSDEMRKAVAVFCTAVDVALNTQILGATLQAELFIQDGSNEDFGGTIDALVTCGNHLTLIDFKYGQGVLVDVRDNAQLLCYALLAASAHQRKTQRVPAVTLTVVQPRRSHADGPVRSWSPSFDELDDFEQRVQNTIRALSTESDGYGGREYLEPPHFSPGNHCRFCPQLAHCPELHARATADAQTEFSAETLSGSDAAEIMRITPALRAYLTAVETWAHGQLESGHDVAGYKLVHRYGNRRYFLPEDEVIRKLRNRGVGKKAATRTQLLSPAQLEKILPENCEAGFLETICARVQTGTTVVPAADRRPQVLRQTAAAEFDGLEFDNDEPSSDSSRTGHASNRDADSPTKLPASI